MERRQRLDPLERHPAFAAALRIVKRLRDLGFEAVFAGGCVRDAMLGESPRDLDLATSAPPDAIEAAFARTLAVGKAFGTVVVIEEGRSFEVTTFRSETGYVDGRHPTQVQFTTMAEDAQRRDFTVNALFYDPLAATIIDLVDGVQDLRAGLLRAVGNPSERFREDHLRLLRAVRFVAQLGFTLEPKTAAAVGAHSGLLASVSAERILAEVKRLLVASHMSRALEIARASGLIQVFWPELTQGEMSMPTLPLFATWENAFASLMWLSGKLDACESRLRAWKASRESLRAVEAQVNAVRTLARPTSTRAERLRALGGDGFDEIITLATLVLGASALKPFIDDYVKVADSNGQLPRPFVTGQDLVSMGMRPGPEMGELLKVLYDEQLEGRVRSKDEALKLAH